MRNITCLALGLLAATGAPAGADSTGAAIAALGLIGVWSDDCGREITAAREGFRIIFAMPPEGPPTYVTIGSDHGHKTTVRSIVLAAAAAGAGSLEVKLRIVGGDLDGGPLPSPTTNTFYQIVERLSADRVRLAGTIPKTLERCRN